jgi:hypothetical protein
MSILIYQVMEAPILHHSFSNTYRKVFYLKGLPPFLSTYCSSTCHLVAFDLTICESDQAAA